MLSIFICEDDVKQKERYLKAVQDTIMIENLDMEIALSTTDPFSLIEHLKENDTTGIYFLDIDLKAKINGIELAAEIRKYDPRGFIVFITTHSEMSYITFLCKVEAMDFIIKDNFTDIEDRIHQCIMNANEKYSAKTVSELQKNFTMRIDDKVIHMEYKKILFFETSPIKHKVILHAIDRQIEFYANMKEIEEEVDDRFVRCHQSYLVNKDNIKEVDIKHRMARMINGETCLVSIRLMKKLKQ